MKYIDIHPILVDVFMKKMPKEILDISYYFDNISIIIQIVVISSYDFNNYLEIIKRKFMSHDTQIKVIHVTANDFNNMQDSWTPLSYKWLDNTLFSRAEL